MQKCNVTYRKVRYSVSSLFAQYGLEEFIMFCLAGCSKKGECEECGQYESLKKYVTENGDENWYCEDCYRLAKFFL